MSSIAEPALAALHARLLDRLRSLGSALVAFSGGVDSALVLRLAKDALSERAIAVTARSPSFAPEELEAALGTAREIGVPVRLLDTDEITLRGYAENPLSRCFFCKSELYGKMRPLAAALGLAHVVDGTNADDAHGHDRPGMDAAQREGVRSPLLEEGVTKAEVRALARALGLSVAEKPAMACLSSRIPFGEEITEAKLAQVARAEGALRTLGLEGARVRHHGDVARIEVPPARLADALAPDLRSRLIDATKAAGFVYVTLDLEGYRAGSMHEPFLRKPSPGKTLPMVS